MEEIKKHGTISQEMLEKYSAYTGTSLPEDDSYKLVEGSFDTSFCNDKLTLRYTNYNNGKERFFQMLTTQLERNLMYIPIWRPVAERKEAGEQLSMANMTINNLNQYINTLTKPNGINTWKIYKLLKKIYRFFLPKKDV